LRTQAQSLAVADLLALLGAGLAWGLTPAVTKLGGHTGIPVLAWSGLQAGAAALMLGALVLATGRRLPADRHGMLYCLASGVIGLAFPNVLLFIGMRHVPAGFFALLAPLSPVLTALMLGLSGQERVSRIVVLGSVLATAGAVLAMLPGAALPDRQALPWAAALMLVPSAYAASNVVAAVWRPPGIDGMALAAGTLAASALVLLPLAWAFGHIEGAAGTWHAALPWIIAQGALQAIAFTFFFRMIVSQGGVFASQVAYVITLSGVLWGMLLFAERPGWLTVPAALLVFAGLYLLTRRRAVAGPRPPG
jgi:drug/metabolite transporter (DMT)-like permease